MRLVCKLRAVPHMLMAKFQMLYCPFVPFSFCVQLSDFGSAWCASVDEVKLIFYLVSFHCLQYNLLAWTCAYRRVLTRIAFSQSELHSLHVLIAFSYTYPATELSHRISYPTTTLPRNDHTAFLTLQLHYNSRNCLVSCLSFCIIRRLAVHLVSIRNFVILFLIILDGRLHLSVLMQRLLFSPNPSHMFAFIIFKL